MALATFVILPSADIHVTNGQDVEVKVIGFDDAGAAVANPINNQCTFNIVNTSVATVSAAGVVHRVADGITFMTVEHTATKLNLVARIWAHPAIDSLHLGNKRGSVNVGSDNFQPKIVAVFSDLETEDVTGHPYVTYQSQNPGLFSVDAATGRVTGIAAGNGTLRISQAGGATLGDIPITVNESLATARPIAEAVTLMGTGEDKRNILFLAEGFTAADEADFRQMVRAVDRRMRRSRLHEPFRLLRRDYNTWLAFTPSAEPGISVGPMLMDGNPEMGISYDDVQPGVTGNFSLYELIDLVGFPTAADIHRGLNFATAQAEWASIPGFSAARLEPGIFQTWNIGTRTWTPTLDKDTALGLMYGQRLGDRIATTATKATDNKWYRELKAVEQFIYKDARRTSSSLLADNLTDYVHNHARLSDHWAHDFFALLASLRRQGAAAGDPLFNIGQRWAKDGPDQALVIVLVNDDINAANYFLLPNVCGFVTAGRRNTFSRGSLSTDAVVDHTPNPSSRFLPSLVSHVTHELCHGIFLGDEYEDIRENGNHTLTVSTPPTLEETAEIVGVELFHNIQTRVSIDQLGLKWTSALRFVGSSALLSDGVINRAAGTIDCELYPGEVGKWSVGLNVFVFSKNLNHLADVPFYVSYNAHDHARVFGTISAIAGDTVTVSGIAATLDPTDVFPKGSILHVPQLHSGAPVGLTLPGVVTWMNTSGGNAGTTNQPAVDRFLTGKGAGSSRSCDTPNRALVNTPHPIAGVQIAHGDRHWLVGAHEGGGTYNCDVVRPSAVCKMRQEYWYPRENRGHFRFCHVCRYAIVQEFNGSRHTDLDRLYQGSIV